MFNIHQSQLELVTAISKLDPSKLGNYARVDDLENNAAYIEQLCKLVANHIEAVMADADASQSCSKVYEDDARQLIDLGVELGAQIAKAAEVMDGEKAA